MAYLRKACAAGALGYVLKAAADVELMQAVHEVAGGRRYVHPALGAALIGGTPAPGDHRGTASMALSDREEEILRLVALGYTNTEMAEMMTLSVRTVETYRHRLQQKVGLRSRAELARLARDSGLLGGGSPVPVRVRIFYDGPSVRSVVDPVASVTLGYSR